jgi:hypothetical protein
MVACVIFMLLATAIAAGELSPGDTLPSPLSVATLDGALNVGGNDTLIHFYNASDVAQEYMYTGALVQVRRLPELTQLCMCRPQPTTPAAGPALANLRRSSSAACRAPRTLCSSAPRPPGRLPGSRPRG